MSTLNATNIKHGSSGTNNIVLDSTGNVEITGDLGAGNVEITGNLGVGTTTPTQKLHVVGNQTRVLIDSTNSSSNVGISFGDNGTSVGGVLYSNSDDAMLFQTNGTTERARIDSSGRLLVGTSSTSNVNVRTIFQGTGSAPSGTAYIFASMGRNNPTNGQELGAFAFSDNGHSVSAKLTAICEGSWTTGTDQPSALVFSNTADGTSTPTERMRIASTGRVGINDSTSGYAELLQVEGTGNTQNAYCLASKVGTTATAFHVRFADTTGVIGSITSNAGTVAYNPFLGCHWARLENGEKIEVPVGTIIETVDKELEWNFAVFDYQGETKKMAWNGSEKVGETVEVSYEGNTYTATIEPESVDANILNKHICVKVNDTPNSSAVFGVFFGHDSDEGSTDFIGSWNDFYVAAVGNYFIRIAAQETVQIGDLISSNGTGCGVVQATDTITNKTVAKITSTKKHAVYEDGSYLVTCVLYSG